MSHTDVVRVASVPSGHVYVRHLSAVDADERVIRLPDPPTDKTGRWWPPAMLHSEWVRDHAQEFDVLHVHFGFDAQSVESLHSFVEALDAVDRPLVMTVHDLRNPHHADRRDHDAQLDVLIPAASAVLTLTPGAALEIERRWGVRAEVTPHPHVFDLADIDRPRPAHSDFVIGLHCKSVRACMDPGPVVGAILEVITDLPSARLVVDVHTDVMTPGNRNHVPQLAAQLTREAAGGRLTLHVHDYYTHEQLRDYLAGLDLSVLPYRFGTHSGWAEGCYDLGTGVLAPNCGFYAEQIDCFTYRWDDSGALDTESLRRAIHAAYDARGRLPRATLAGRINQRDQVADQHRRVYESVIRSR